MSSVTVTGLLLGLLSELSVLLLVLLFLLLLLLVLLLFEDGFFDSVLLFVLFGLVTVTVDVSISSGLSGFSDSRFTSADFLGAVVGSEFSVGFSVSTVGSVSASVTSTSVCVCVCCDFLFLSCSRFYLLSTATCDC